MAEGRTSIVKSQARRAVALVAASLVWPIGCLLSIDEGRLEPGPADGGATDAGARDARAPEAEAPVPSTPGTLDVTFGDGGIVVLGENAKRRDGAQCLAVDDGDRLYVVGAIDSAHAARLNPDGTLDTRWGGAGMSNTPLSYIASCLLDADGGLLLYGSGTLVRISPAGEFDMTFGEGGLAKHTPQGFPYQGKLITRRREERSSLIVGAVHTDGGLGQLLVRFSETGQPMTTRMRTAPLASNVLIRPDGTSWTVGSESDSTRIELARHGQNLEPGPTFETELVAGAAFTEPPRAAVQPDGKVVLAAAIDSGRLEIFRFDDGGLDRAFGTAGRVSIALDGTATALDVAVQQDGKIVVIGAAAAEGQKDGVLVVRLTPNGELDTSFGTNGALALPPFTPEGSRPKALGFMKDGRIVVVSDSLVAPEVSGPPPYSHVVLTRIWP